MRARTRARLKARLRTRAQLDRLSFRQDLFCKEATKRAKQAMNSGRPMLYEDKQSAIDDWLKKIGQVEYSMPENASQRLFWLLRKGRCIDIDDNEGNNHCGDPNCWTSSIAIIKYASCVHHRRTLKIQVNEVRGTCTLVLRACQEMHLLCPYLPRDGLMMVDGSCRIQPHGHVQIRYIYIYFLKKKRNTRACELLNEKISEEFI